MTHRPGRMHSNADGLSRQAWLDDDTAHTPPTASQQKEKGEVLGSPNSMEPHL